MPRKKRVLIIVHLCLAFAFFSWLLLQPWVKEVVSRKSEISLYEMAMQREAHFSALPLEKQLELVEGYEEAQLRPKPALMKEVGNLFFVSTPPFALAWLFFSIVICLLLLFRIEGAAHAAWILPLCVLGYGYFLYSSPPERPTDSIFPAEEYVRTTYPPLEEGLNQRDALIHSWNHYLIREWAGHESVSEDPQSRETQLNEGLFAFNIERLAALRAGKGDDIITAAFTAPPSLARLLCYFVWNGLFAWLVNRRSKSEAPSLQSSSA